jgi:hypothetical protein
VKVAIKKHLDRLPGDRGVAILGVAIAVYLLSQQDFRFPLVEAKPKQISIELANAQAVQPGQGRRARGGRGGGRISA